MRGGELEGNEREKGVAGDWAGDEGTVLASLQKRV